MRTILVIREADDFSRVLTDEGFQVINLPLIETKALDDLSEFERRLEKIDAYDGIFLTSRRAARILAETLRDKKISCSGKVYVLGRRSFEILSTENLDLVFDEAADTALEMLENIAPEELENRRFLFVRGERSLGTIPGFLEKTAAVDEAIVYETRKIAVGIDKIDEIREKIDSKEIAAACFFSPSGAESFLEQFGAEILHQTRIATIGTTTAAFFEKRNLRVGFVSPKSSAEDFAFGLIDYLRNGKRETENGK